MNAEMIDDTKAVEAVTAIAEYSETAQALAKLRDQYKDVVFPVATKEGNAAARLARRTLVTLRTTLDKKRKELKAPAQERLKLIDDEAKRITAKIVLLEDPIDAAILAQEKADEERKEAARKIEEERKAKVTAAIEAIRRSSDMVGRPSAEIIATIFVMKHREITLEEFDDQTGVADMARTDALDRLETLLEAALVQEAQQAEIVRQQQELEALRAAERQRQADADAERAETDRKEREAREAAAEVNRKAIEEERAALQRERDELNALLATQRKQQDELATQQRLIQENKDREAETEIARAEEIARKEREQLEAQELESRRQRQRDEDEAREQRLRDEEAAALAKSKAERAAMQMLEALEAWAAADAKDPGMTLAKARGLRTAAIKAATE